MEKFWGGVPTPIAKTDQFPDGVTIKREELKRNGREAIVTCEGKGIYATEEAFGDDEDGEDRQNHVDLG
jgi:hypothetical protein